MRQDFDHEETGSYLASISDLMSGLLFIFIITLMAFVIDHQTATEEIVTKEEEIAALQKNQEKLKIDMEKKIDQLTQVQQRLESNDMIRARLLSVLQEKLQNEYKIQVTIDPISGVLRLNENAITFASGSSELDQKNIGKLAVIRSVFEEILPCFAYQPASELNCDRIIKADYSTNLEAIFIEGHTDNTRYKNDNTGQANLLLSVNRAVRTYAELITPSNVLMDMKNKSDEIIFSVSGYGEERPLEGHRHTKHTNDPANRRIDIRFIMASPELTAVEKQLLKNGFEG